MASGHGWMAGWGGDMRVEGGCEVVYRVSSNTCLPNAAVLLFLASSYIWGYLVWDTDTSPPFSMALWAFFVYVEANSRSTEPSFLDRPLACHCVGFPLLVLSLSLRKIGVPSEGASCRFLCSLNHKNSCFIKHPLVWPCCILFSHQHNEHAQVFCLETD